MPIYEYICPDCKIRFEALRSMSQADDPIACENCAGEKALRAVSAAFAHSGRHVIAGKSSSSGGCGSCAGGSCSSCGH